MDQQVTGPTPHPPDSARFHLGSFWTHWLRQPRCQGGACGAAGSASALGSAFGGRRPAYAGPYPRGAIQERLTRHMGGAAVMPSSLVLALSRSRQPRLWRPLRAVARDRDLPRPLTCRPLTRAGRYEEVRQQKSPQITDGTGDIGQMPADGEHIRGFRSGSEPQRRFSRSAKTKDGVNQGANLQVRR